MNKKYWNKHYRKFNLNRPSNFAKYCLKYIRKKDRNIDIGCGNGRDTYFFLKKGYNFIGIDLSNKAIELNKKNFGNFFFKKDICSKSFNLNFKKKKKFKNVYARFFLHAISLKDQVQFFKNIKKILLKDGKVMLEFRTTKDPTMRLGKKISLSERISTHYRRFIDVDQFDREIILDGFKIIYKKQSFNFAKYKRQKPHICRMILKQKEYYNFLFIK